MNQNTQKFELEIFRPEKVLVRHAQDITKEDILKFKPFEIWAHNLKSSLALQRSDPNHPFHDCPYSLKSVNIQSVDKFGPVRIGFLKLKAEITNENKEALDGIAFLRGGSVAMLMILRPSDKKDERWVVMTEQPRIPAGSLSFWEIPAGMIDDSNNFAGAAAKEIREEIGLEVPESELVNLTKLALEGEEVEEGLESAMYPSPGGSDEFIAIFLWEKTLDRQEIEDLRGKLGGVRTRGEKITVRILNYEKLWKVGARDSKTLAAWSLYEALKRSKHPAVRERPLETAGRYSQRLREAKTHEFVAS